MIRHEVNPEAIKKAAEICGGNQKLAFKAKVSYSALIDWRGGRRTPNLISIIKIEKATEGKVTRRNILPTYPWDMFKEEIKEEDI